MLEDTGFVDVTIGPPVDTFKGASGEEKARKFAVYGSVCCTKAQMKSGGGARPPALAVAAVRGAVGPRVIQGNKRQAGGSKPTEKRCGLVWFVCRLTANFHVEDRPRAITP